MIYKIITVALLSTFEIYAAIGTGLAMQLTANQICIATLIGGITGVFASVFLGTQIKTFIAKFRKPKEKTEGKKDKFIVVLWEKYGVFGVGCIGTFLVGAPISIGIGIGLGVDAKKLLWISLITVIVRSILFSYFFNYLKTIVI